ncbi:MAG: translation initiation factor IF-2 N-terminal domain-containing protein, partial [bacterium]|nr:translation initiation factor IF-2 N-terminal domain-containing protein [bacterium]
MATGKLRIFELAKELQISSKDLMALFGKLGIDVKNHMSVVDDHIADLVRGVLLGKANLAAPAAPKAAAPAAPPRPVAQAPAPPPAAAPKKPSLPPRPRLDFTADAGVPTLKPVPAGRRLVAEM